MKRLAVPLLAAGVFLAAVRGPALEIPLAPDYVLQWAQGNVARGTDFLAQGEFYLAELQLEGARNHCDGLLSGLAGQDALLPDLDGPLAALREACAGVSDDPEASFRAALDARTGLQKVRDAISVGNPAGLPGDLERILASAVSRLDALRQAPELPSSEDLAETLDAILRDIGNHLARTDIHRAAVEALSPGIDKALLALENERAHPDVPRILAVARKHIDDASDKLDRPDDPHSVNIEWDLELAGHALDDLRRSGPFPEEGAVLEQRIEAGTIRLNRHKARRYLEKAREALRAGFPSLARSHLASVPFCLERLPSGDPARDELAREAATIRQEAEKTEREREDEGLRQSLANVRTRIGSPDAPVASGHLLFPSDTSPDGLARFAAGTDFAAELRAESAFADTVVSIHRVSGKPGYAYLRPDGFGQDAVRAAFAAAGNAPFPDPFPDPERYSIAIVREDCGEEWFVRTNPATGEPFILPRRRHLDVVRTSAAPDDAFLFFAGDALPLSAPGAPTARIPGLGAILRELFPRPAPPGFATTPVP